MFYGNIGSDERLDFTVVGPAVNEVARIAAMCWSVERNVLLSRAFARHGEIGTLPAGGKPAYTHRDDTPYQDLRGCGP
jgi:class 3 adenylate cyclase